VFTAGPSTPSQTAWAILGRIAGGDPASLSVQHGIEFLLDTQRGDGSWEEELATGTGFPRLFYLNYHLYKDYFPLLALSSYVKARSFDSASEPRPGGRGRAPHQVAHETRTRHRSLRVPRLACRAGTAGARIPGTRPGAPGKPGGRSRCRMRHRGPGPCRLARACGGGLRAALPRGGRLPSVGQR